MNGETNSKRGSISKIIKIIVSQSRLDRDGPVLSLPEHPRLSERLRAVEGDEGAAAEGRA